MGRLIWGSEFHLVRRNSANNKMVVRFIAPEDRHEWTIYIRVNFLIVTNQIQQLVDNLGEPTVEVIDDHTSFGLMTY